MFSIFFTNQAAKEYKKLPNFIRADIQELLDGDFSMNPQSRVLDIKKLKAPFSGFRLRSGSYRVLFTIDGKSVVIYSVKHRKDAYK